jgi:hypothetical protein
VKNTTRIIIKEAKMKKILTTIIGLTLSGMAAAQCNSQGYGSEYIQVIGSTSGGSQSVTNKISCFPVGARYYISGENTNSQDQNFIAQARSPICRHTKTGAMSYTLEASGNGGNSSDQYYICEFVCINAP